MPIGVSTGNATATNLATGTIGCRVKDPSGAVYALSNNHVYALENTALIGSEVLQPGLYSAGDSGSLIVTQSGNNPVGLLFAGSSSVTIANNINDVLAALGGLGYQVAIDGQ